MARYLVAPLLVLSLLPIVAEAQQVRLVPPGTSVLLQTTTSSATDQRAIALQRKATAKKKILVGLGLVGVGLVVSTNGAGDVSCKTTSTTVSCDSGSHLGLAIACNLAGAGLFGWGMYDIYEANQELNRLAGQKTSNLLPISDHQSIVASSFGSRTAVGYGLSW